MSVKSAAEVIESLKRRTRDLRDGSIILTAQDARTLLLELERRAMASASSDEEFIGEEPRGAA